MRLRSLVPVLSFVLVLGIAAHADDGDDGYGVLPENSFNWQPPVFESSGGGDDSPVISITTDPQTALDNSFRMAASEDRLSDLERLLESGAQVNSRSERGMTALMYASRNCYEDIFSALISKNSKINLQDSSGTTALMYAVNAGCFPLVKRLVAVSGVNLYLRDDMGKSAIDDARDEALLDVDGPTVRTLQLLENIENRKSRPRRFAR